MRRLPFLLSLLVVLAAPVAAQTNGAVPPVPDAKPPVVSPIDDTLEPQVTISQRDGNTIEEHRINGRLYRIKVTPENGVPYTLVDPNGDGTFSPEDATPGSSGMAVPMWVIGTF